LAPRYDAEKDRLNLSPMDLFPPAHRGIGAAWGFEDRATAGRDIHRLYAERRAGEHEDFRPEEPLHATLTVDGAEIELNARIDGSWRDGGVIVIEEVKSTHPRVDLPRSQHLNQLDCYLWMHTLAGGREVRGRLTYFLPDGTEFSFDRERSGEVEHHFVQRIRTLLRWHRAESKRLRQRAALAEDLRWPFPEYREGQEELEAQAEATVREGRLLLCEAPTGMGKTASLLLGALRTCARTGSRLLYATSRTSQQSDRLELLRSFGPPEVLGRVLLLGSQERLGMDHSHPAEPWPFDRYDPPEWFDPLWSGDGMLTPEQVTAAAGENAVDPRSLQRELAFYADVLIGDLNLLALPGSAYHPTRFEKPFRRVALLVDEAHGLPDRLRDRVASNLQLKQLNRLGKKFEGSTSPELQPAATALIELHRALNERMRPEEIDLDLPRRERIEIEAEGWGPLIENASFALSALEPNGDEPERELRIELDKLLRFGGLDAFTFWIDRSSKSLRSELIDTGDLFSESWKRLQSALFFSATLPPSPLFVRDLGLPAERTSLCILPDVDDRANRLVLRFAGLSTTFRRRDEHLETLTDLLAELPKRTQGRWAVFFPSTTYLRNAESALAGKGITLAVLRKGVPVRLLERILAGAPGAALLMAVMGGSIAEGVELPAGDYHGCIIVSPGTPPPSARMELLLERFEDDQEARFQALHLPGIIRARQAAGRLFRAPDQRGMLILVGRRYADEGLLTLLPDAWASGPVVQSIPEVLDVIDRWW